MSTASDEPEPPARVIAVAVEIDDGRWWACPIGGAGCCRVAAEIGEWAADAIAWHVSNHHRSWR